MVMKKIILILLLTAGLQQVKAQQSQVKLNNFVLNSIQQPKPDSLSNKVSAINQDNIVVNDHMPVAKTSNTDRMPVVTPGAPRVKYTMLVKKVTIIDPADQPAVVVAP
jgi:hypothetical protein